MIDPREKERLFEEAIARNHHWLGFIARNNAPIDSWEDLEQEIRIALKIAARAHAIRLPQPKTKLLSTNIS